MSIQTIIQDVTSFLNVIVLAVGYFFLVRLYREWIHQSREERIAGGRPMVVVAADYGHLPEVHVVVRNFTKAPAKEVTFEFSTPVEDPDGAVLSELPYFENGLPFLEQGGGQLLLGLHAGDLVAAQREGPRGRHQGDHQVQGPGQRILRERMDPKPAPLRRYHHRGFPGDGRPREGRGEDPRRI